MPPAKLFIAALLFFSLCTVSLSGQSLSSAPVKPLFASLERQENDGQELHQAFFSDREKDLYFVDFEKISVNLQNVVVRSSDGAVVLEENVFDLPVDAIYELDFSRYAPGVYQVELRAFTEVIRQKIKVD